MKSIGINVRLALAALKASKLRAALTMFGVIVGVFAFVLVTTFFEGFRGSITEQLGEFGGRLVAVVSGKVADIDEEGNVTNLNFAASFGASTLTEKDLMDIRDMEETGATAPQMLITGAVRRGEVTAAGALINATNEDFPAALNQTVESGEFFTDDRADKGFAVVGPAIIEDLFGGNVSLGAKITVSGQEFTILGVMEEQTASFLGPDLNRAVYIPLEAGKEINGGAVLIQEIDAQINPDYDIDETVAKMNEILSDNHRGEEDFTVLKAQQFEQLTSDIIDVIKTGSQAIAGMMVFVGAIVILLIMLITVTERTKEIGVRKSIGATPGNIMIQFITESVVISWFGSLIGVFLAFLVGLLVANSTGITPAYSINTMVMVVVLATIIGAVAGVYPAWRASRLDPVEALRHE